MGIPKYYRYMSERYPSLSAVVEEAEVCSIWLLSHRLHHQRACLYCTDC